MYLSDVVVMQLCLSFVSLGLRKGVELVEALTCGHPQDSNRAHLTGTVCFQECTS